MHRIHICGHFQAARVAYRDSLHAAILNAWDKAGAKHDDIYGLKAKSWVFGVEGPVKNHNQIITKLTISTSDAGLSEILHNLNPADISINSPHGDTICLAGGEKVSEPDPFAPGQTSLYADFAAPFIISTPKATRTDKNYIHDYEDLDLPAAFSHILSRRLGKPVAVNVVVDRLAVATLASLKKIIPFKRAGGRVIFLPAWSFPIELQGDTETLRAAWYGGVGEKNRNGFGCLKAVI